MTPCPSRRRELAELVDGSLGIRDAERLNAHLIGCPGCRSEVASLRQVRERLRADADSVTSPDLTDRLLSIAGPGADQPLYARPFDPHPAGALPSLRRRTRRTVAGAVTLTCLLLAGFVGVGWAAAPPVVTPAVDPGPVAREEFAAVLSSGPLANPALTAARATGFTHAKTDVVVGPDAPTGPKSGAGARELLERADAAPFHTSFAGRQVVQVRHLAGFWVTEADVEIHPGRGVRITFPNRVGAHRSALLPASTSIGIDRLAENYELLTVPGPRVADRDSVVVEAHRDGRLAARWWLDVDAGLLLWQQTFGRSGEVTLSAGFRSIMVGPLAMPRSLPPRLGPRGATSTVAVTHMETLRSEGWLCNRSLAGLDRVTVRFDRREPMVHTAYGDGVATLSVMQQKGALVGVPDGFVWDPERKVFRGLGLTTTYSWQSGDSVLTVATDGDAELADRALAELPHTHSTHPTHADRVLDGWRSLLGLT